MEKRELYAQRLEMAERQFSLASAVQLATTEGRQPLDLPTVWTHGKHEVRYEEIALTNKEADIAAFYLQRCATYIMATQVHEALKKLFPNPKIQPQPEIQAAYQISRMIRNAFAHNIFDPIWSIDNDCRNRVFEISGIIKFDTSSLDGKRFDWRHYGGPLALLKLSQFVREKILNAPRHHREVPPQIRKRFQQGNLILTELSDEEAEDTRKKGHMRKVVASKNGKIHLPGGHAIQGKAEIWETKDIDP